MNWTTPVACPVRAKSWNQKQKFLLMGSCFSENMYHRLSRYRFDVHSNPNGIIFHPMPLADAMWRILQGLPYNHSDVVYNGHGFVSMAHHGAWKESSAEGLLQALEENRLKYQTIARNTDVVIVTFGSAWGYWEIERKQWVANCHRLPQQNFTKEITALDIMFEKWRTLMALWKNWNPHVEFVFTVSPIRHTREGMIENNRSKARLIELAHQLVATHQYASYFPSYEIMLDELRDYRFYKEDMIHPSEVALDYIWHKFLTTQFDAHTMQRCKALEPWLLRKEHRSMHESAEDTIQRQRECDQKIEFILKNNSR
jgi:GSCFA family